jgi:hypothetical protein
MQYDVLLDTSQHSAERCAMELLGKLDADPGGHWRGATDTLERLNLPG